MASGKEKNGIEEIYEKYYKDVYRFVLALSKNPHIAEDITQETFVKAIKAVDRFKGDCDIKVWLCQSMISYLSRLRIAAYSNSISGSRG